MMSLFAFLLAALAAPDAPSPRSVVNLTMLGGDGLKVVPPKSKLAGSIVVELTFGPDGSATNCRVVAPSRPARPEMDRILCERMQRAAHVAVAELPVRTKQFRIAGRFPLAPVPLTPIPDLFTADDYPPEAIDADEQGRTVMKIDVLADGRIDGCRVVGSSGSERLDQAGCDIVRRRAQFEPALSATGKPVFGSYISSVTWRLEGDASAPMMSQLLRFDAEGQGVECLAVDAATPLPPHPYCLSQMVDAMTRLPLAARAGRVLRVDVGMADADSEEYRAIIAPNPPTLLRDLAVARYDKGKMVECDATQSERLDFDKTACELMSLYPPRSWTHAAMIFQIRDWTGGAR